MAKVDFVVDQLKYGWSIIPIEAKGKRPLTAWARYQSEKASADQIRKWWAVHPDSNYGVVTGKVSDLFVVDIDGEDGLKSAQGLKLPHTTTVVTGKGLQFWYRYPGEVAKNYVRIKPGIDIRTDNGYVVGPGSTHSNGKIYSWDTDASPEDYPFQPIDIETIEKLVKPIDKSPEKRTSESRFSPLAEGNRNYSAASLVGYLIARNLPLEDCREIMRLWNLRHNPPLPERELESVVQSIWKRDPKGENAASGFDPKPIQDWLRFIGPEIKYLWKPYIETNGITLLAGNAKEGKSTFAAHLAKAVVSGEIFLDSQITPGKVLFIELEEPSQRFGVRCKVVGIEGEAWLHLGKLSANSVFYSELEQFIQAKNINLVIINSMVRYMDIENENDARQIEDAIEPLLDLRNRVTCAFLIIHHASKLGTVRGSTHIQAMVDTILLLRKLNEEDSYGPRELLAKGRDSSIPPKITFKREENKMILIPNLDRSDRKTEAARWLEGG